MSFTMTPLPPLPDTFPRRPKTLPELRPLFSISPLEDRPQNPIADALVEISPEPATYLPEFREEEERNNDEKVEQDIWASEGTWQRRRKNQNLSWDMLRPTFPTEATSTAFLSEQSNDVFDAIRHIVRPRLNDPSLRLRYILPTELLESLMMNMVGNSSSLYMWDPEHEHFVAKGVHDGTRQMVIIEGLDDVASDSVIRRFLTIGTLMRRLDILVLSIQRCSSKTTIHAFSHAVSMVLLHMRSVLTRKPFHLARRLTSLWLHYADAVALLSALADLCGRNEHKQPPYEPLPESPGAFLSHIYKQLQRHIENRSPRAISAMVAYILTIASRDYFIGIEESLGIYNPARPAWLRTAPPPRKDWDYDSELFQPEGDVFNPAAVSSVSELSDEDELPDFLPLEFAEALPVARKSLRFLRAADPDHPLCSTPVVTACQWVWSPEEIERLWMDCKSRKVSEYNSHGNHETLLVIPTTLPKKYKLELEKFELFDLEPGAHSTGSDPRLESPDSRLTFQSFLSAFPERLAPLTPTLQHLATVVVQPLLTRTIHLSNSLLHLFLSSLHLETHLTLLRSYMLLTRPSFRASLVGALFSDSDQHLPVGRGVRERVRASPGIVDARYAAEAAPKRGTVRGIGLRPGLAERDTWPPGGADLSYFLRTVIVDSLERRTTNNEGVDSVWKEAEVRLGFALRELSIGDGNEKWLDPTSIEALDFLYLDYKPPRPLDIIISPDVLSKYQRIFTFLLRLLRAETVARITYRSSFKSSGPVFADDPEAQKIFLRLRFQIQTFVTSLLTYVFDSAIGGNFDAYMDRVSKLRGGGVDDAPLVHGKGMMNVFLLAQSHSEVLDHILGGCLLRTTQRSAGDALTYLLDLVLQFGTLFMEMKCGYLPETDATKQLYILDRLFQTQMLSFVKTVHILHLKDQAPGKNVHSLQPSSDMLGDNGFCMDPCSPFENLLVRVDPTGWWRGKLEKLGV